MADRKKCLSLTALLLIILHGFLFSGTIKKEGDIVLLDRTFFKKFSRLHQITRDDFLDNMLNSIIRGRGIVLSIDKMNRYNKDSRVIAIPSDSGNYNLKIRYYIFLDNKTSISMLSENITLEFKGQFMNYTPVNTKRNEYIFDIVLESGAVLVEK